jgi:hypothetical protein
MPKNKDFGPGLISKFFFFLTFLVPDRKIKNAAENAIKRSCNFMNVKISV